ncbi:hypothetical protein [Nonomuraea dietziae]|uniref:Uncharacterized protein n=1 Tax=Nonomuraea dietziae TaxID=65515 RepID=A0A7W5VQD3_9ACTN|nr:hypothetical protein [Nonomuraea dietziae]MBB3732437.1 hypothetical protein [Nonomuraea dietziae]
MPHGTRFPTKSNSTISGEDDLDELRRIGVSEQSARPLAGCDLDRFGEPDDQPEQD